MTRGSSCSGAWSLSDARTRLERLERERAAVADRDDETAEAHETETRKAAEADLSKAAGARTRAANTADKAGVKAAAAAADEREAGEAFRAAERALAEIRAEVGALRAVDAQEGSSDWESVADNARPDPGYELAFAAALGDEALAGLSNAAPRWWVG